MRALFHARRLHNFYLAVFVGLWIPSVQAALRALEPNFAGFDLPTRILMILCALSALMVIINSKKEESLLIEPVITDEKIANLTKIKYLQDSGLISDEDYQEYKKKILNDVIKK